ncbi:MAG TPA: hypothetical protein VF899_19215 [Pyrinomonadaceae bacterium]
MIMNLSKLFLALCLLTVGGGIVANAQIDNDSIIEANVPFSFVVGKTTLPAGKYEIKGIDDATPGVLELRAKGRKTINFETEAAQMRDGEPATKTELVFDKVGDKYFLSQVWVAGNGSGSQLVKSKMEKRVEGDGTRTERHSIDAFLRRLKP